MVNPLARINMQKNLKDDVNVKDYSYQTKNTFNLDTNESLLIQKIIQGKGKVPNLSNTSKTLTLEEAAQKIRNGR